MTNVCLSNSTKVFKCRSNHLASLQKQLSFGESIMRSILPIAFLAINAAVSYLSLRHSPPKYSMFTQALPRNYLQDAIAIYPEFTGRQSFGGNFGRIYGDYQPAEEGQFPYVAHLQLETYYGKFTCGATLLDASTLVAAAHCIRGLRHTNITVGTTNWKNPGPNAQFRTRGSSRLHEDNSYGDDGIVAADIGFLSVEAFELNEFVQPITVAENEPTAGSLVTAIGFGQTEAFGGPSDTLNYATDLMIVEDSEADVFNLRVEFEHFICTYQDDKGTCLGDSGSPVIDEDGNLIGIASLGWQNCALGPSCFTSIPYFRPWLEEAAGIDI